MEWLKGHRTKLLAASVILAALGRIAHSLANGELPPADVVIEVLLAFQGLAARAPGAEALEKAKSGPAFAVTLGSGIAPPAS